LQKKHAVIIQFELTAAVRLEQGSSCVYLLLNLGNFSHQKLTIRFAKMLHSIAAILALPIEMAFSKEELKHGQGVPRGSRKRQAFWRISHVDSARFKRFGRAKTAVQRALRAGSWANFLDGGARLFRKMSTIHKLVPRLLIDLRRALCL